MNRRYPSHSARRRLISDNTSGILRAHQGLGVLRALWLPDRGVWANGGVVAAWRDLVHGYVAAQATPGKQPAYTPTGWDGKPCLTFDGSDDILVCTASALVAPFAGTDSNTVLAVAHDSSDVTATVVCLGGTTTTDTAQYHLGASSADYYYRGATNLSVASGSGSRHTIVRNTGTNWEILRNGVSVAGPAAKASTTMAPGRLSLGAYLTDALETYYTAANIGPVALYSTLDDPAGLTSLWNKLGWRHA